MSEDGFCIRFKDTKTNYLNQVLQRTIYAKDCDTSGKKMLEGLQQLGIEPKAACEHLIMSDKEYAKRFAVLFADVAAVGMLDSSPEVRKIAHKILGEKNDED